MIVIIDFGSQTTHLIYRRLKQLGVETIISHPKNVLNNLNKNIKGLILSGGPSSVYEKNSPLIDKKIFNLNIPILGICYGLQLISHLLKGKVVAGNQEYGPEKISVLKKSLLFENLPKEFTVWMSHGDEVVEIPKNFEIIASTDKVKNAAIENKQQKIYGIQFHPEIYHTQYGTELLINFVEKICCLKTTYNFLDINKIVKEIRKKYQQDGGGKVIAAVSGGIDSTVASALVVKAIEAKNFFPVYIDNGLMRYDNKEKVKYIFKDILKTNLKIINAEKIFLKKLKGIINPEKKREIIGRLYVKLFEKEAKKIKNVSFLMQGTIYSDVVESGSSLGKSAKIKSHHNVAGLPKKMKLKLLEPLREFYKDEVRQIGKILGLPNEVINTQPFPGPGYAIRIIGEVTKKRLKKIKKIDQIVYKILKEEDLIDKIFQSFPVLTGIKSTAVKGDNRAYGEVIGLRIYESQDIMSASWAKIPYNILDKIAQEIIKNVHDVSRVVYDITTKPPATMEWE